MFKIQDLKTGLYSSGGYFPRWDANGKIYKSLGEVKAALALYERGEPVRGLNFKTAKAKADEAKRRRRKVPPTWVVIEYAMTPVKTHETRDVMTRRYPVVGKPGRG